MLAAIAIPWFVLQTTNSASQTGITAFFTALPTLIAAFFGGVFVDRFGYKRTSVSADLINAAMVTLIPLLFSTVGLNFWALQAIVFFGNLLDVPGATARSAMLPELAVLAEMPIERALALNEAMMRTSRLIGGPLAGVLIAVFGATSVLWIDAATFIISALLIAVAVPLLRTRTADQPASVKRGYVEELREGVQFVWQDRLIQNIIIVTMITNLLDASLFSVIYPVYADQIFKSTAPIGFLVAAVGGAALIGSIFVGVYGTRLPRRVVFAVGYTLAGLRFFALAAFSPYAILIGVSILAGLGAGVLNPIMSTVQFERIPVEMRARVIGVISAGAIGAVPLGVLMTGFVLDKLGLGGTLWLYGLCYLFTTLSIAVNPIMRSMNRPTAIIQDSETSNKL
jgi:MFS family permease